MTNPFKRRWFRVIAWFLMSVLTLIALLWLSINWVGARALRAAEAKFNAAGESIDINEVLPGSVPDERNFCAIPILKDLALVVDGNGDAGEPGAKRKRLRGLEFWKDDLKSVGKRPKKPEGARTGVPCDMAAWSNFLIGMRPNAARSDNPARTVLECLSVQDALVAELAAGLNRPDAQWTPDWKARMSGKSPYEMASPHLLAVIPVSGALALRATAAARCGESGKAHEALQVLIKINEANTNESFFIGLLVSSNLTTLTADVVWEVCDARIGTSEDYQRIEQAYSRFDTRACLLDAARSEYAWIHQVFREMKKAGNLDMVSDGSLWSRSIGRLLPRGVYDGSSAAIADYMLDALIVPLRDRGWLDALDRVEEREMEVGSKPVWKRGWGFQLALTNIAGQMSNLVRRSLREQCLIDQTVIACVLEQHRIEKGGYPETLEGLSLSSGKPLPIDIVSGKPMGYRKTPDGKYMLWSVGLDRTDDGGKQIERRLRPTEKGAKGDWVWSYSPEK